MRPLRRDGIILILFSGLVALLVMVAVAMIAFAREGMSAARAVVEAQSIRLAAESGVEYAAGRLGADPYPLNDGRWSVAGRGDDWSFRDGPYVALGGSLNPSYSHGEAWVDDLTDASLRIGVYDKGFEGLPLPEPERFDRDGNGRLSAWSGRMRGNAAAPSVVFSLRIDSAGSRFPVNGGLLDGADRNGVNGPDHGDTGILLHAGIAHALNNLGALILPSGHPRRLDLTTPGEPVWYSLLGMDLIQRRPLRGYRTSADVRSALSPLGYTAGQVETIRQLLDLRVPAATPQFGPPVTLNLSQTCTPLPMMELLTASPDVLRCLFQYLATGSQTLYWEAGAAAEPNPRTGQPYGTSRWVIFPDEAFRLAHHAVAYRRTAWTGGSLQGLYQHWLNVGESMNAVYPVDFNLPPDHIGRCDLIAGTYPAAHRRYAQAKIDMAFAAISPDPQPHVVGSAPTWSGWGLDRNPGLAGIQPFATQCAWGGLQQIDLAAPFSASGPGIAPLPLSFRAPTRFLITSAGKGWGSSGAALSRSGAVEVSEHLLLSSQQDFENPWPDPELQRVLGITAVNDAWVGDLNTGRRRGMDVDLLDPSIATDDRRYRQIASLPAWDRDSHPTVFPPTSPYSRFYGALTLAAREGGVRGANLYWTFGETDAGVLFGAPVKNGDTVANFLSDPPSAVPWRNGSGVPPNPNISGPPSFSPYHITGDMAMAEGGMMPQGCPGIPGGQRVGQFSIEGWCAFTGSPVSVFSLSGDLATKNFLRLLVSRVGGAAPALRFEVQSKWMSTAHATLPDEPPLSVQAVLQPPLVVDVPDDERTSHIHHFAMTVTSPGSNYPFLSFFLDGVPRGMPWPCWMPISGGTASLDGTFTETVRLRGMDDLRLYDRAIPLAEAKANFELGRFVRSGVYRSPRYVPDEPVQLGRCRWSGIVPPAYYDADLSTDPLGTAPDYPNPARCQPRMDAGVPPKPVPAVNPIVVKVIGYSDADGATEAWSEAWDVPGEERDFSGNGEIRSFRYEVRLGAVNVAGPLIDTPVFESIELGIRRRSRRMERLGWSPE